MGFVNCAVPIFKMKTFLLENQYSKFWFFTCTRTVIPNSEQGGIDSWGCRIHLLDLCRRVRPPNEYPGYDIKQSNGEGPVKLEFWEMRSTPSLPLLPCPLWLGVVALERLLPMGQIELFDI